MSKFEESSDTIINFDETSYAVGLTWSTANSLKEAPREARALAASLKKDGIRVDHFCVRGGDTPQFGLSQEIEGHKVGLLSLAGTLANDKPGNWIGLFEVDDGYYFIAIRDSAVLPECDLFFSDADVAINHFQAQLFNEWDEIICPADLEISETEEINIEDMLLYSTSPVKLEKINKAKDYIVYAVIAVAVLLSCFGAFKGYEAYEEYKLSQVIPEKVIAFVKKKPVEVVFVPPWRELEKPSSHLSRCLASYKSKLVLDTPGWGFKGISCTKNDLILGYAPFSSSITKHLPWFRHILEKRNLGDFTLQDNGGQTKVIYMLDGEAQTRASEETISIDKASDYLSAHFNEHNLIYSFTRGNVPPPVPPEEVRYQFLDFRISLLINPVSLIKLLETVPSLFLNRITFNYDQNIWILEGSIYEKLKK